MPGPAIIEDIPAASFSPETEILGHRLEWIDAAKGIGMFLVIWEHASWAYYPPWNHVFVSFVMPMFFLLAGLTYNNKKYRNDLKGFLSSRGKQFMIPYFILMALWIIMAAAVPSTSIQSASELVFWFAYGAGPPTGSPHLWFLPMMFLAMVIFVVFDKVMEHLPPISKWLLIAIFPLFTIYLNTSFSEFLVANWPLTTGLIPWRLGGVLIAATFMIIGNEIRRFIKLRDWTFNNLGLDLGALLGMGMILLALSEMNGYTDIASDVLGSVWIYLLTGVIGTYIMFAGSTLLVRNTTRFKNFLVRIGNASQEIYELHPMTLRVVAPLLGLLGVTNWWLNPDWWLVNSIIICITTIPLVFYVISKSKYLQIMFKGSTK
jgi:fucose 4-O-acetylase-like acetyltransferase